MIELRRHGRSPLRVGHRGAPLLAPENTLASLHRAVEEGVDIVEFDVLGLPDGELVLAHSYDLHELSRGAARGHARAMSLSDVRRVAPDLPTLDEALGYFSGDGAGVGMHLDLKRPGYEHAIVRALQRHGLVDRAVVTSFFASSLRALARTESRLRFGISFPYDRYGVARRRVLTPAIVAGAAALRRVLPFRIERLVARSGAAVASLHYLVVTHSTIDRCHRRDAAVFAWTVDDPVRAARLAEAGVDGIVTNDPRIFRR